MFRTGWEGGSKSVLGTVRGRGSEQGGREEIGPSVGSAYFNQFLLHVGNKFHVL